MNLALVFARSCLAYSPLSLCRCPSTSSKQIHAANADDRIGAGWLGTGRPDGRTSAFARDTKTQSETTTSLCSLRLQLSFSVLQKCYLLNTSSVCCCFILKCRVLLATSTDRLLACWLAGGEKRCLHQSDSE